MIVGKIESETHADGSIHHIGEFEVHRETVTAGVVANGYIPDGPTPGFERVTKRWVEPSLIKDGQTGQNPTYTSSVEFHIVDRKIRQIQVQENVKLTIPEKIARVFTRLPERESQDAV